MTTPSKRIVLDYTSRDYKSIRASLVGLAKGLMPEWQTVGENGDFGTLLLELYAYAGDVMNYYIDRVGAEAFLGTAMRRQSVLYIADMFGYRPLGQRAASTALTLTWEWDTDKLQGGVLPTSEYTVTSAVSTNGQVKLSLTGNNVGVDVSVGQTITVSGLTNITSGSKFVVRGVEPAVNDVPFKAIIQLPTTTSWSETNLTAAKVVSGQSVIVPARTRVSTSPDSDGNSVVFETDRDVVLDSASASQTTAGSTIYRVRDIVTAYEGVSMSAVRIGTSQGIPSAEFTIPDPGVIDQTVKVYTREGGQAIVWSKVDKMSLASPTQSVFTTYVDDQDYTHVLFGDNASGRIPPTNVEIYVDYRYGVGSKGNNIGVNALTTINDDYVSSLGVTVTNQFSPVGGTDVETVESMRYSIPRAAALKQRAVTLDDFVNLALQVPGITKAVAYGSNYSTIFIRIASGPQSQANATYDITGRYFSESGKLGTVALSTSVEGSVSVGQVVYLTNVFSGSGVSVIVKSIYPPSLGNRITNVAVTYVNAAGNADTVTLTTEVNHSFKVGQPIFVSGVSVPNATNANINGYRIVTAVTTNTVSFKTDTGLSANYAGAVTASDSVTVGSRLGFTFDVPSSKTVSDSTAIQLLNSGDWTSTTSTATTIDPTMQILINNLEQYLADKKLIGSVVYGEPVEWNNVDLKVQVAVRPLYNRAAVQGAVQAAIQTVFSYDNVNFGKRISIGDVYRAGLGVDGVDYIVVTQMVESSVASTNLTTVRDVNTVAIDANNAYRIPRINPSLTDWVTATGGLANT